LGGEGRIDVIFDPNSGEYKKDGNWEAGVPVRDDNYNFNDIKFYDTKKTQRETLGIDI